MIFLCKNCKPVHDNSSGTKEHEVITVEAYRNLPSSILSITNRCLMHKEQYKFYCINHEEPICSLCKIGRHLNCNDVPPFNEEKKQSKSSTAIENLEKILHEIEDTFKTVKNNIENDISEIGHQKASFILEIENTRKCINDHLDEIQKQVIVELSETAETKQQMLQKQLNDMETRHRVFQEIRNDLAKTKTFATNTQTLIGVKHFGTETIEQTKKINGTLTYDHYKLGFEMLSKLQHFAQFINSFGIVSVQSETFLEPIKSYKVSTGKTRCLVADIPLSYDTGKAVNIQGCDLLPDGKLVFADQTSERLILYESERRYEKDINLPSVPFDVKHTENNIVAVTMPLKRQMHFIDVITGETIRVVHIKHRCYGIDTNSQKLVVRARPKYTASCFFVFDFEGTRVSRINIRDWYSEYISVGDEAIPCTELKANAVHCYGKDGKMLWTFKDESLLRSPSGISQDKHGNVFVVGSVTNNVVVLSADGSLLHSDILSKSDGLNAPCSLRIDVDRNELLVCNQNGSAFVYSLIYD